MAQYVLYGLSIKCSFAAFARHGKFVFFLNNGEVDSILVFLYLLVLVCLTWKLKKKN